MVLILNFLIGKIKNEKNNFMNKVALGDVIISFVLKTNV